MLCKWLVCLSVLVTVVLLSLTLSKLDKKKSGKGGKKPLKEVKNNDQRKRKVLRQNGENCLPQAGFDSVNAGCCAPTDEETGEPLTYFSGPGGNFCVPKGSDQQQYCEMACSLDEGGIDDKCNSSCMSL